MWVTERTDSKNFISSHVIYAMSFIGNKPHRNILEWLFNILVLLLCFIPWLVVTYYLKLFIPPPYWKWCWMNVHVSEEVAEFAREKSRHICTFSHGCRCHINDKWVCIQFFDRLITSCSHYHIWSTMKVLLMLRWFSFNTWD